MVVGIDGAHQADHAVRWAVRYSARRGVPVRIVVAAPPRPAARVMDRLPGRLFRRLNVDGDAVAARALRIAAEAAPTAPVTAEVAAGTVVKTLVEVSKSAHTLVLDGQGRGRMGRAVVGSLGTTIARLADCPVAVVRTPGGEPGAGAAAGPVVVGVDGTASGIPALDTGFAEAAATGAHLVAVHTWGHAGATYFSARDAARWQGEASAEQAVLSERLAGYSADFPDVVVQKVVTTGRAAETLAAWAPTAQLVVLGSRRGGGRTGMASGSTVVAVLRAARCPVMIAR
ncbi:universal stress protein [Tomitella gaofuii]|uniref:universal stress protein n=1 Tax=Tomitella gaofuii TaxID=2760083 RepID=UPI0020BE4026|nr:universal stress protein [Tomitella gaofuii]